MLERKYRLQAKEKFTKATTRHTPFFTLKIVHNHLPYNRFGFVVSKKIDKRSVVRNRFKRRFRSCIERFFQDMGKGKDFLFILHNQGVVASTETLCSSLKVILFDTNKL